MTHNEFYYLILVLAGFAAFGLAMAAASVHDRRWAARAVSRKR